MCSYLGLPCWEQWVGMSETTFHDFPFTGINNLNFGSHKGIPEALRLFYICKKPCFSLKAPLLFEVMYIKLPKIWKAALAIRQGKYF